jgi:hypothetical protein
VSTIFERQPSAHSVFWVFIFRNNKISCYAAPFPHNLRHIQAFIVRRDELFCCPLMSVRVLCYQRTCHNSLPPRYRPLHQLPILVMTYQSARCNIPEVFALQWHPYNNFTSHKVDHILTSSTATYQDQDDVCGQKHKYSWASYSDVSKEFNVYVV